MAVNINKHVKVINTPKGLVGYGSASKTSQKITTINNGATFRADKMDTDDSGIWYRDTATKAWFLYRSAAGKVHLKTINDTDSPRSLVSPLIDIKSPPSLLQYIDTGITGSFARGPVRENVFTGVSTLESIGVLQAKDSPPKSNQSTTTKKNSEIKTDVVQQNDANYPPVSHTDEHGNIWYDWTINLDSFHDSVMAIKRNLNIPSAYNRIQLAKLTSTKFNRHKIEFGDYKLKPTISYVVFTRPDLNLFDNATKEILPQIVNDPTMYYIWKNNPSILKQLCLAHASDNKFIPLLTNQVTALDVLDESIDTIETGETWSGYKMQYAKHSIRSMTAGSISVKFPETYDLSITHMFQTWCSYESGVYRGTLMPEDIYCMYKILDYACDIYYFLMDPDMTIRFWSVYYGAFPTNINKSIFSYDSGNSAVGAEANVTFAYFHKLDLDPRSLVDFNEISGGTDKDLEYRVEVDPSVCLGGGGSTWSGAPFVQAVKGIGPDGEVDELKLRFRK